MSFSAFEINPLPNWVMVNVKPFAGIEVKLNNKKPIAFGQLIIKNAKQSYEQQWRKM